MFIAYPSEDKLGEPTTYDLGIWDNLWEPKFFKDNGQNILLSISKGIFEIRYDNGIHSLGCHYFSMKMLS